MKNENDYLSSNPGSFENNTSSEGYLKEHSNHITAQIALPGNYEASSGDDTGWEEPLTYYGSSYLEEETY